MASALPSLDRMRQRCEAVIFITINTYVQLFLPTTSWKHGPNPQCVSAAQARSHSPLQCRRRLQICRNAPLANLNGNGCSCKNPSQREAGEHPRSPDARSKT
eukprot:3050850-Pleurochrysis_carterae.AAC.3